MKDLEFIYSDSLVSLDELNKGASVLSEYIGHVSEVASSKEKMYEEPESSINLPFDSKEYENIKEVADQVDKKFLKYIIVVGIGGSNLGTKAISDAVNGTLDPFLEKESPKIIFVDTTSSKLLEDTLNILRERVEVPKEVVVNIISKSGATTETIANFEIIYSALKDRFKDEDEIKNQIVVTTDEGSKLWAMANEQGIKSLSIPKVVGGRYSVFSSVGLFPLILAGVNVDELLEGARVMRDKCLREDVLENPALSSALLIYLHNKNGISINNTFFFNPHFESIGRWYRQLMGESIGKKYSLDGAEVNAGITPIVSIGSTDLHSMAQLYLGGPKDKLTTFVYSPSPGENIAVPDELLFHSLVENIEGKGLSKVMSAIFRGVKEAYRKNGLPFVEVILPEKSEYFMGQFLQFKMIEMMYLSRLLGVNAFDQPNVEDYKQETRNILHEEG